MTSIPVASESILERRFHQVLCVVFYFSESEIYFQWEGNEVPVLFLKYSSIQVLFSFCEGLLVYPILYP